MKYVIDKSNNNMKLMYYNVKMNGLVVNPINQVEDLDIKAKNVLFVDKKLTDTYIKKRVNRKINKIINFMLRILNDDGTTEEDSGIVLDEINRLKGIVINKYKEYMIESEYKALLTRLILIEEEFKKSYNEKILMNYSNNNYYEEEIKTSRGR